MKIGVLALQGAFIEHRKTLDKLHTDSFEIRNRNDFDQPMDGLILPGGESTTMDKLLHELNLFDPIKKSIEDGLPVFGTCAGMILLAKNVIDYKPHFGIMDTTVKRNAYGRQLGSFYTEAEFKGLGQIPMTFIRAPYITAVGENVEVLSVVRHNIVAVREKNMLATAFHPELTDSTAVHQYFLSEFCKK